MRHLLVIIGLITAFSGAAGAAAYYLDPVSGSPRNPGTAQLPWQSIEYALQHLRSGDTLLLSDGFYGAVTISGKFDSDVTIKPLAGAHAVFSRIQLAQARHLRLEALEIDASLRPYQRPYTLVDVSRDAEENLMTRCLLRSASDISKWSAHDWVSRSCSGINVRGSRNRILNNRLMNIDHGISLVGSANEATDNWIENFSGDGIRILGDDTKVRCNRIQNCYNVDDNHDDGIQSWSATSQGVGTGIVKNVLIEGNLIINQLDPHQKFPGPLQGIGCFDGFYQDWTIANNIILVNHWHGITLLGARHCKILNNTVIDPVPDRPGPPWIMIAPHKNKQPSRDNLVRNNLAPRIACNADIGRVDHNLEIDRYDTLFVDYAALNFNLTAHSPARDAGNNDDITPLDFNRHPRCTDGRVDLGAIEAGDINASATNPPDTSDPTYPPGSPAPDPAP